ncbi:MAG: hypothetical protein EOO34_00720 [Cyanobacteriota bacterium]|nr:MAG: hypothetical protein EOO34_00720 [Cyanobacteriota bacterium]
MVLVLWGPCPIIKNVVFDACFYHCYAMISKGQDVKNIMDRRKSFLTLITPSFKGNSNKFLTNPDLTALFAKVDQYTL